MIKDLIETTRYKIKINIIEIVIEIKLHYIQHVEIKD